MWESTQSASYELPCGVTWVASEQRLGEYTVALTRGTVDAGRCTTGGPAVPVPCTDVLAAAARLARLLSMPASI